MKLLIWDFDGTLGYRDGGWAATLAEIACEEKPAHNITAEQFLSYLQAGFPWHTPDRPHPEIRSAEQWWNALNPVFERAFREAGFDPSCIPRMVKKVRHLFPAPARWHPFEDSIPTLAHLASQSWTHVVLSNHVPELPHIIYHLGLNSYIARVFTSAETGYEKPHPQAFRCVLDALAGVETAWMIGDSMEADVAGAEAVGISAILVRRYHERARYYCPSLWQVPSVLNR